jgi:peroxiredoxin
MLIGLHSSWLRYLAVTVLSFPLALGIRFILQKLIPVNLAKDAVAFVREEKETPLAEPLARILADRDFQTCPAQPHPLLGETAEDFTLLDESHQAVNLHECIRQGPVVLVFYYGYSCSHCVAQLFGIEEDLALFQGLGARVLAVSSDPPETTTERYREYGRFSFSLLSDADNSVAFTYGVYRPALESRPVAKAHATFLIGTDGRIFWANYGPKPFLDNKTLLIELARKMGLAKPPEGELARRPEPPSAQ